MTPWDLNLVPLEPQILPLEAIRDISYFTLTHKMDFFLSIFASFGLLTSTRTSFFHPHVCLQFIRRRYPSNTRMQLGLSDRLSLSLQMVPIKVNQLLLSPFLGGSGRPLSKLVVSSIRFHLFLSKNSLLDYSVPFGFLCIRLLFARFARLPNGLLLTRFLSFTG